MDKPKLNGGGSPARVTYTVNQLGNSGPGSFREALEASGPRKVVFTVHGTIELERAITIDDPDIEILGETAPGGGICIKGSIVVATHDVKISHSRIRSGEYDEIVISPPAHHIVLDHCSFSWAVDENVDIGPVHDVEVRWCIISEGLHNSIHPKGPHSMGLITSGADRISIHHCLFACNDQRNPAIDCGRIDVINNVMYIVATSAAQITDAKGLTRINFINNYQRFAIGSAPQARNYVWSHGDETIQIYRDGNIVEGVAGEIFRLPYGYPGEVERYMVDTPFPLLVNGEIQSAEDAYASVLASAGATLPIRDSADIRVVQQVIDQSGRLIDDPSEVGGWPEL